MKKMTRMILAAAGFALAGLALAACSKGGAAAQPGKLTEVSLLIWDRGTTPADQGTVDSNWWTRYNDEQLAPLGIKMTWVMIPRQQEAQMLSTMLAANNAPDLSKTNEIPLLKTYISGGGIADITPHVDKFGGDIKALMGDVIEDVKMDGKLYYLPHLNNGITCRTTWIRQDWLDAVGMKTPSTAEEFYQVLKAVKQRDPGKVGAPLIPLAMNGQTFSLWDLIVMPGFVKEPPSKERFLTPFPMWPESRDALRWLNKLHAEGLLTDELILDKDESLIRQKISRGEVFAFIFFGHYPYHSAYGGLYDKIRERSPQAVLANIDTFRQGPNAERLEFYPSNPAYQYRWFVPASAKNVEAAVKALNWMSSPAGYMTGGLGIEGQDYTMVNGVPTPIDQKAYLARVPWIEPQHGLMAKPFPRPADKELFLLNYIKDFNPAYHEQIKKEAHFISDIKYFPPTISVPTPVSDKLTPVVTGFWNDQIAKIITAPPANFDRLFDDTLRQYREMGGDEIAAEARKLYRP